MKVHFLVTQRLRILEYAMVSIRSLIERGSVAPSDIVLTMESKLKHCAFELFLKKYPITLEETPLIISKISAVQRVFKKYPEIDKIIQLDADTILTRDMDFLDLCAGLNNDLGTYEYKAPSSIDQFHNRFCCNIDNFKTCWELPKFRFEQIIDALFDGEQEDFEKWVGRNHWIYGGFIFINRSILSKPIWRKIRAYALISHCDESAIQLARWCAETHKEDFDFQILNIPSFNHVVSPKVFDLNDPRGVIHYAGEWYRTNRPENKKLIDSLIEETIKSCIN